MTRGSRLAPFTLDTRQPIRLKVNSYGSVDVWFGPEAPHGMENDWVPTIPGKRWFMILRLCGPRDPWFNQTWRPGEIELQSR